MNEQTDCQVQPHWWFRGATVLALKAQLATADEHTVLTCRPDGDKLYLGVTLAGDASKAAFGELNDSHLCPPDCT